MTIDNNCLDCQRTPAVGDCTYNPGSVFCNFLAKAYTAKQTEGKLDLTLVSPYLIEGVAEVRNWSTKGKYPDPHNWKTVDKSDWVKAVFRHFLKILKGEKYDQESGLSHWKHIGCNVNFILEMEAVEND